MEVKRDWDLDALADAHELLDLKEDQERQQMAEMERERGQRR